MQPEHLKYLYDIQQAARKIESFCAGYSLPTWLGDELLQSAVERQFEIIGEAVNQLHKVGPEVSTRLPDYRKMIAFRNLLIHGYSTVDPLIVWGMVEADLPALIRCVDMLMTEG